jgi:hypothetical protein
VDIPNNEESITMATLDEIAAAIRTFSNADENGWDGDAGDFVNALESAGLRNPRSVELPNVGTAVYVDGEGGYEGGPESINIVFRLGDNLYRMTGSYDSYDADRWYAETVEAVVPVEKTVIIYEVVE